MKQYHYYANLQFPRYEVAQPADALCTHAIVTNMILAAFKRDGEGELPLTVVVSTELAYRLGDLPKHLFALRVFSHDSNDALEIAKIICSDHEINIHGRRLRQFDFTITLT